MLSCMYIMDIQPLKQKNRVHHRLYAPYHTMKIGIPCNNPYYSRAASHCASILIRIDGNNSILKISLNVILIILSCMVDAVD